MPVRRTVRRTRRTPPPWGLDHQGDRKMAVLPDDLPNMVFRRVAKEKFGEFSIDNQMLTVLINLDGYKTLGEIATRAGMTTQSLLGAVSKMLQMGLIEPLEDAVPILSKDFLRYLKLQLSRIVGPIADILIEDAADTLGYRPLKVPRHRAAELVDLLSKEISDEGKRIVFTRNMVAKINSDQ